MPCPDEGRADGSAEALQALHRLLHGDPALQARLFALEEPADFVAAVRQLASSIGYTLEENEVLQAMNAGSRAWIERALP